MQVWKAEDPRVNIEKRFAHYEIYTWTLCHSYLHENSIPNFKKGHLFFQLENSRLKSIQYQYVRTLPNKQIMHFKWSLHNFFLFYREGGGG